MGKRERQRTFKNFITVFCKCVIFNPRGKGTVNEMDTIKCQLCCLSYKYPHLEKRGNSISQKPQKPGKNIITFPQLPA